MRESDYSRPPAFRRAWLAPAFWGIWLGLVLLWVLSWLPIRWRHWLGRLAGALAYRINQKRRRVVEVNLQLCFPDWPAARREQVARAHFAAMGCTFLDYGLLWFGSDARLKRHLRIEGWSHQQTLRARSTQVIYHVAHGIGLEFGALAVGVREPAVGLYQRFKNPLVEWLVARSRRRFGNRVFQRKDGLRAYVRCLRRGKALYSLTDEDLGSESAAKVVFFAHPKSTLVTAARLAKLADAGVLPMMTFFEPQSGQYVTRLLPPIVGLSGEAQHADADALLLNQALQRLIEMAPEQYMWTLKLFRSSGAAALYKQHKGA